MNLPMQDEHAIRETRELVLTSLRALPIDLMTLRTPLNLPSFSRTTLLDLLRGCVKRSLEIRSLQEHIRVVLATFRRLRRSSFRPAAGHALGNGVAPTLSESARNVERPSSSVIRPCVVRLDDRTTSMGAGSSGAARTSRSIGRAYYGHARERRVKA